MTTMTHTTHTHRYRSAGPRAGCGDDVRGYRYRRPAERLRPVEAVVVALVILLLLASTIASGHRGRGAVKASASVRVAPGQTLWAIARQHPVDGLTTAQTADLIADLNHLGSASLAAGSVIRVPVPPASNTALAVR